MIALTKAFVMLDLREVIVWGQINGTGPIRFGPVLA